MIFEGLPPRKFSAKSYLPLRGIPMFYYTSIVLLAIAILLIENHDILFSRSVSQNIPVIKRSKEFLYGVLV